MPKARDDNGSSAAAFSCGACAGLGGEQAADRAKLRHQHYLAFDASDELSRHLEGQQAPEDWVRAVTAWHAMKKAWERSDWKLEQQRRERDAVVIFEDGRQA